MHVTLLRLIAHSLGVSSPYYLTWSLSMFIRVILLRQLKECQGVPATAQDYESEPHTSTNISDLCVAWSCHGVAGMRLLWKHFRKCNGKDFEVHTLYRTSQPNFHNGCLHYGRSCQLCLLVLCVVVFKSQCCFLHLQHTVTEIFTH